jgi:hypothetical protein
VTFGVYKVVGNREYRGHKPGTVFHARLDRNAERRAILRRDIQLIGHITPQVPSSRTFPEGWLPDQPVHTNRGAARRLSR